MERALLVCSAVALLASVSQQSPLDQQWRVVGGSAAFEGQFPYVVSLKKNGRHSCGASIINDRWILTAAHCVTGVPADTLTVVAGTTKLNSSGDVYEVQKIVTHDQWDSWKLVNDISILKVKTSIQFSDKVQPIPLAKEWVDDEVEAILCGWGTTSFPGPAPNDLQFVKLKTISNQVCKTKQTAREIIDSHLCTLTKKGEGVCHSDSGGPLTSGGVQIGIVSWGRPCAIGYPDVYTRVSEFKEWIHRYVK